MYPTTNTKPVSGSAEIRQTWPERSFVRLLPKWLASLKSRFMGLTWGLSGADRTQVGPMWAPWTSLSGMFEHWTALVLVRMHAQRSLTYMWFYKSRKIRMTFDIATYTGLYFSFFNDICFIVNRNFRPRFSKNISAIDCLCWQWIFQQFLRWN